MDEGTSARAEPATVSVGDVGTRPDDATPSLDPAPPQLERYEVPDRDGCRLGEGAMGVVYRARDTKLGREVALKVVRRQHVRIAGERRLLREAQAMAQVNHPNVVTVFDVGSDRGRVWMAMELVEGTNLAGWLRARPRSWTEIVEVFAAAGRGLAAVHAVGLTHRDFKPANVLVARDGRVCVGDFGLTKAGSDSVDGSGPSDPTSASSSVVGTTGEPLTELGIVMGTPAYMAPEQYAGDGTAASDQYAFCVALWEGLCGRRPFAGDYDALMEAKAIAPTWPSSAGVPASVGRAIVRGLDPDPERRFADMDELLRAIDPARGRRRLAGTAVAVVGIVGAGAVWLALAGGREEAGCADAAQRAAELWSAADREAVREAFARSDAPDAAASFDWVAGRLDAAVDGWAEAYRQACASTTPETAELDVKMACLRDEAHAIEATVEVFAEADREVVLRAGSTLPAEDAAARCLQLRTGEGGALAPPPAAVADEVASLEAELARAHALYRAARFADGVAKMPDLVARAEATGYAPIHARALLQQGRLLRGQGHYEEAAERLAEAGEVAMTVDDLRTGAEAASLRGYILARDLHHPEESLRYARQGLALAIRAAPDSGLVAMAHSHLATAEEMAGNFAAAIEQFEQSLAIDRKLGDTHDEMTTKAALADAYAEMGDNAKAESLLREVLAAQSEQEFLDRTGRAHTLNNLGGIVARQSRHDEALELFRAGLELRREVLGDDHPVVGESWMNIGTLLGSLGRYEEAERNHRRGLKIMEAALGPDNPRIALALNGLADDLTRQDREEEALVLFRRSLDLRIKAYGPQDRRVLIASMNLANTLSELHHYEEADRRYAEAAELARTIEGGLEYLPHVLTANATSLAHRDQHERAVALLREAIELMGARPEGHDPARLADSRYRLGRSLAALGEEAEARSLLRQALEFERATFGEDHERTRKVRKALDGLSVPAAG